MRRGRAGGWFALTALGLLVLGRAGVALGGPADLLAWSDPAALFLALLVPAARTLQAVWRRSYTTSALLTVAGLGAAACGAAASGTVAILSCGALDAWQRRIWQATWRRLDRRARKQGGTLHIDRRLEQLVGIEYRTLRRAESFAGPFVLLGVGTALFSLAAPFLLGDPVSVWLQRATTCLLVATPGFFFTATLLSQLQGMTVGAGGVAAGARVTIGGLVAVVVKTVLLVAACRGSVAMTGVVGWEAGMILVMGIGLLWSCDRLVRGRFEPGFAKAYNKRA